MLFIASYDILPLALRFAIVTGLRPSAKVRMASSGAYIPHDVLNSLILNWLLLEGHLDAAETFVKEAKIQRTREHLIRLV